MMMLMMMMRMMVCLSENWVYPKDNTLDGVFVLIYHHMLWLFAKLSDNPNDDSS